MIGAMSRHISRVKAIRKRNLDRQVTWYSETRGYGMYDNLHQYSKNKIHCSCPMCSAKTRNKGRRHGMAKNYNRSINYKISDLKKVMSLTQQEKEYFGNPDPTV